MPHRGTLLSRYWLSTSGTPCVGCLPPVLLVALGGERYVYSQNANLQNTWMITATCISGTPKFTQRYPYPHPQYIFRYTFTRTHMHVTYMYTYENSCTCTLMRIVVTTKCTRLARSGKDENQQLDLSALAWLHFARLRKHARSARLAGAGRVWGGAAASRLSS